MSSDARREHLAIEAWFRRNGLPHLIAGYDPREDTLTRLRPALAAIFLAGLAIGLRPDWPAWLRVLAVLAGLLIAGVAIAVVNVVRGRRWSASPRRVGFGEATALVLVPPVAALILGEDLARAGLLALASVLVALALYALASFGILPLLVGQAQRALVGAITTASIAVRAMAIMLALLLFLSLSTETWRAFGTLAGWRFGGVMILFGLLAAVVLVAGLRQERSRLQSPEDDPRLEEHARSTPAAPLVRRGVQPAFPDLGRIARLNVGLAMVISLALRVLAVGAAVGLLFLVFAVLVVDRQLTVEWVGQDPNILASESIAGREVVLSAAAVRVATLLGAFAGLYFTVVAVGDAANRKEFVDDEIERLSRVIAAWAFYRGDLTDPRDDAPRDARSPRAG